MNALMFIKYAFTYEHKAALYTAMCIMYWGFLDIYSVLTCFFVFR